MVILFDQTCRDPFRAGIAGDGDRIARLHRVLVPAAVGQIDRALELDGPVHPLALRAADVQKDVHVRIAPVHERDDARERLRLALVELRRDGVMRQDRDAGQTCEHDGRRETARDELH